MAAKRPGRKSLKVRTLRRKKLPYGKYKYLVILDLAPHQLRSKRYNILESYYCLVEFQTKRERNEIRRLTRNDFDRKNDVWSIDKIEDELKEFAIGRVRLDYRNHRPRALYIYLTDFEDMTVLLMNHQNIIFRIYKILPEGKLKD